MTFSSGALRHLNRRFWGGGCSRSLHQSWFRFSPATGAASLGILLGVTLGVAAPMQAQTAPASAQVRSTLRLGSQGAEVAELQTILQFLGFYLGRVDGVFSESTQQAVQRFQQAAALPLTGQMTLGDWNRLLPTPPTSSTAVGQPAQSAPITTPSVATPPVATPSVTAQSFPIPESASQPPSGSAQPPKLPPSESQNPRSSAEAPTPQSPEDRTMEAVAEAVVETVAEDSQERVDFPLLRRSSEGLAVEQLQQRLSALGFYAEAIDGIFGEATEDSVKQFQAEYGLEADGIVGSETWQTLFNTP